MAREEGEYRVSEACEEMSENRLGEDDLRSAAISASEWSGRHVRTFVDEGVCDHSEKMMKRPKEKDISQA